MIQLTKLSCVNADSVHGFVFFFAFLVGWMSRLQDFMLMGCVHESLTEFACQRGEISESHYFCRHISKKSTLSMSP